MDFCRKYHLLQDTLKTGIGGRNLTGPSPTAEISGLLCLRMNGVTNMARIHQHYAEAFTSKLKFRSTINH